MTAHPNRSRADSPASNPSPERVRAAREVAGLTQTQAGALVFGTLRAWQSWEDGGPAGRRMPAAAWHLFLLRTQQHPRAQLVGDVTG